MREEHTWPAVGQRHLGTCQSHGGTSVMGEERGEKTKHGEGHRQCNVRPSNTGCGQRDVDATLTTSEYRKRASVHIN